MCVSFKKFRFLYGLSNSKYMPDKAFGEAYHYTSLSATESILFANSEYITFLATRSDCFDDKNEGKLAIQRYKEACEGLREYLREEVYSFFINIIPEETCLFAFPQGDGDLYEYRKCKWYVVSLTNDADSDYLWRNYGAVNFELIIGEICNTYRPKQVVDIYYVIYDKEQQIKLIQSFIKDLAKYYNKERKGTIQDLIQSQLNEWKMLFKGCEYEPEDELRIIIRVDAAEAETHESDNHWRFELDKERCSRIIVNYQSPKAPPKPMNEIKDDIREKLLKEIYDSSGFRLQFLPSCDTFVLERNEWREIHEKNK